MFDYLRGKLIDILDDDWILEVGGVGFRVKVTPFAGEKKSGDEVKLFLRFFLRENGESFWYGFEEEKERAVFDFLRDIRGVGPKTAFKILSRLPWREFVSLIEKEQIAALEKSTNLSGKTLKRVALELKPLLAKSGFEAEGQDLGENWIEAREVLSSLGYNSKEVESVLRELRKQLEGEEITTEILVKEALAKLGSRFS
ncbi:MAG: holliday junction helicase RuvA [Candidatus Atribacteria bacterium]|nr:holliday junction helicase RuvA [Candidatus Atribacteria bacterium]